MPEIKSGSGISLRPVNGDLFIDGFVPTDSEFVIYVSKSGLDINSGNINQPKLTIASALTRASELLAGDPDCCAVRVDIQGAGRYTESFTVPANVILTGFAASIVGQITLEAKARVNIYAHYPSESNQIMLLKTGGNGAWYTSFISDGRGTAGDLTGCTNAKNESDGSILFVECALLFVSASGRGIEDEAPTFGHIHIDIKDLYLAGENAVGIRLQGGASDAVGYIDHILEVGAQTGTTGISVGQNSLGRLIACEIIADTAWSVSTTGPGGQLWLVCPRVVGATSGSLS